MIPALGFLVLAVIVVQRRLNHPRPALWACVYIALAAIAALTV